MSEWIMQPRNGIEEKLHAMGYRVMQGHYSISAYAPDKTALHSGRHELDECWTSCYQHSESVKAVQGFADERKYQKLVEGMSDDERKACICVVVIEMIKRGETDDLDEQTLNEALEYLKGVMVEEGVDDGKL